MMNMIKKFPSFIFAMSILVLLFIFSKRLMYGLSVLMGFSAFFMGAFLPWLIDDFHFVFKLLFSALAVGGLILLLFSIKEQMKSSDDIKSVNT